MSVKRSWPYLHSLLYHLQDVQRDNGFNNGVFFVFRIMQKTSKSASAVTLTDILSMDDYCCNSFVNNVGDRLPVPTTLHSMFSFRLFHSQLIDRLQNSTRSLAHWSLLLHNSLFTGITLLNQCQSNCHILRTAGNMNPLYSHSSLASLSSHNYRPSLRQ